MKHNTTQRNATQQNNDNLILSRLHSSLPSFLPSFLFCFFRFFLTSFPPSFLPSYLPVLVVTLVVTTSWLSSVTSRHRPLVILEAPGKVVCSRVSNPERWFLCRKRAFTGKGIVPPPAGYKTALRLASFCMWLNKPQLAVPFPVCALLVAPPVMCCIAKDLRVACSVCPT